MKRILDKIADVIKVVFGYAIWFCLMFGGITFFGYLVALICGGNTAALICDIIYNKLYPILVIISTTAILLGLINIYITNSHDLTGKKDSKK